MRRTLWGRATSSNVMKAIWTLEELKLPYERIDVGGSFGKTDTSDYRSMNPTGLVPTLQEDDFTLWESNAICRYLCHAHSPHSKLWPQDPHARATIDHWMDAQQTVLNRPMGVVFWGLVRTPADKRDMAAINTSKKNITEAMAMLDAQLGKTAYVAGAAFSYGDIPVGTMCYRFVQLVPERPSMPNLDRWYAALSARKAFKDQVASVPLS